MEIEKKYNRIFQTDWNQGTRSKVPPLERVEIMNLWLDYNKQEIRKQTIPVSGNTELVVGFID